ncbi:uncharacterized protein LOC126997792 [Eriocheir sinensis]|uniref:uncharacterized protein LOC126997792 n=1 Tax=Eriocheir sinensis TaxID=95602 RepID=UPI0021C685CE|nr:uncharacterized protein LOC126997792 [Eriocheir sinensis]
MRPRRALLLLLFLEASLSALGVPCIRDSTTRPVFSHSAGDFFPGEETTPATCAIQCAVFKLPYVGVDEAANCFCAATIRGLEILDETKECNLKCLGGEPCGEGPGVLSVWNVKDLTGPIFVPYFRLMFTGSANNQMDVTVGTPVDITIKTTESAMLFTLNFGDGSGFRNLNSETSNTTSHTFTMEGEYYITAKEPSTGVLDMVKVVVRGPKNALGLDCPDLAAIGEPFVCTFTLLRGSGSTLMLLAQETGLEHNYSLPDLETKVYGHSWSSEVSPVSSQEVNSCVSNYVLDTAVIMEDECLTMVDGWMASESTVYANTMREKCVNGGVPACPMEGEWTCTPPMYLCGASCRESSLSTCSGGTNTTLKGWTDYTAVTVATIDMPFGYSDMAVPLTPLKPQSFFSVGCITGPLTFSPSAKHIEDTSLLKVVYDLMSRGECLLPRHQREVEAPISTPTPGAVPLSEVHKTGALDEQVANSQGDQQSSRISDSVFAGDAVILAESLEVPVMALKAMLEEVNFLGLQGSWFNTKVMYRDAATSSTQGDALFGTVFSPTFLLGWREPKNFLLRFKTLGGRGEVAQKFSSVYLRMHGA